MNEVILENYRINGQTLAILPAYHIGYQSVVLEGSKTIYVKEKPMKLIESACISGGADYNGSRRAVMCQLDLRRKVPIPVNREKDIYAFPTHSPKQYDCHWLFYSQIFCITPHPDNPQKSQITFINERRLELDIAPWLLVKQMYKTGYVKTKFGLELTGLHNSKEML
ncbi:competence protein ComK [Evansella clarkii]|uniref:competence protein ComK n=1 Tax=Evansella clarkii TaxID=79879 RepID=UPI000B42D136|nr:competence protein ComK [Evansella clarkii]